MSIIVTLEIRSNSENAEKIKLILREAIPETRAFDGCIGIDIHEDINDRGQFMFHEKWETKSKYEAYFSWRSKSEAMEKIGPMLTEPPKITYYDCLDI